MSPEGLKPSENHLLESLFLVGGILLLSQFAFTRPIRREIHTRDEVDVWDGATERLECAHITHDKSDPRYNDTSNGRLLTIRNHYLDHYNREGRNGLTKAGNDWALRAIWNRLTEDEKRGLPLPPEEQTW